MCCSDCGNTGYLMQDIGTATIPDYLDVPCECNPPATDADAPDDDGLLPADLLAAWEPMGTAYDDFQPRFNDRRYAGC